ncbi:alpha-ribazole phosphatase [Desulfosporosinus sp. OT]|uniref:alpha-ribazole phosphatase n=1 Tax=Desulfosporosinus sp. OT TaxID=913865 RepID=UPI000223ADDF|nr:alpha-ribazole phosphatase [Desulfosporosinus sp. OT]EGW38205.1 phosphoglycerate mutase family protein [Desulfosporosinus sp. OT]
MDKKLIYLARHGDIGIGKEKRYIGRLDLPLSAQGEEQAKALKNFFCQVPLDNIYCSDLKRSQQTAHIIASVHQIVPVAHVGLRELNMGDWDGELFSSIKTKHPMEFKLRGEDIANYSPPKGESFSVCYKRVIPVFESLAQSDGTTILIIGHAGANRVILCHILGIPLGNVFRFEQSYGCLNLICREGSNYRLKYLNRTATRGILDQ